MRPLLYFVLACGFLILSEVIAMWFAFQPPAFYVRWPSRRSAHRSPAWESAPLRSQLAEFLLVATRELLLVRGARRRPGSI